jgi:hypothetical protein
MPGQRPGDPEDLTGRAPNDLLQHRYAASFNAPVKPASLVSSGQVVNLPLILGLAVAVFGATTLLRFMLVSVGRRRRIGILKALWFLRRQLSSPGRHRQSRSWPSACPSDWQLAASPGTWPLPTSASQAS